MFYKAYVSPCDGLPESTGEVRLRGPSSMFIALSSRYTRAADGLRLSHHRHCGARRGPQADVTRRYLIQPYHKGNRKLHGILANWWCGPVACAQGPRAALREAGGRAPPLPREDAFISRTTNAGYGNSIPEPNWLERKTSAIPGRDSHLVAGSNVHYSCQSAPHGVDAGSDCSGHPCK